METKQASINFKTKAWKGVLVDCGLQSAEGYEGLVMLN